MKRTYIDSNGFTHKIKEMNIRHLENAIAKLRRYRNPKYYETLARLELEQRRRNQRAGAITVDFNQFIDAGKT